MPRKIPLTKGAFASVDDADYHRIMEVGSWCLTSSGYAIHWYTDPKSGKRKATYMHRLVLNASPGLQVDHIDRNRLNNTRENLRFATRSQNQANKSLQSNNTSRYKGVTRNQGRWEARISYGGKRVYLGRFRSAVMAALHHDAASRILFQDFAGENFPERVTPPCIEKSVSERLSERF